MMRRPMPDLDGVKSAIARAVDALRPELERVALAMHGEPELAYEEHRSAERLVALLALRSAAPKLAGAVRVIGTPAEERGNGKAKLIAAGEFRDVDAARMFHAGTADELDPLMLAMVSLEV